MNTEKVLEIMGRIDPALIEEVGGIEKRKRRLPALARTGLIAACLGVFLLSTAFAAAPEEVAALIERLTVSLVSTEEHTGYSVEGEMIQYPLSSFSPALNAASEAREDPATPVSVYFDTWDEVQAFLGGGIPCVWPNGGADWDGRYQVTLFHTELERLWGIQIYSIDLGCQTQVSVDIYTEHWSNLSGSIAGVYDSPANSMEHLGSYYTAGGSAAEIVVNTGSVDTEHVPKCQAHGSFMKLGILYRVETFGTASTRDETVSRLKAILDSFA